MFHLREEVKRLCNSPQRVQILDALDDCEKDVRTLISELDSPRSTVQRNLSILEEQRWIERGSEGYSTINVGDLLCSELERLNEIARTTTRLRPFFENADITPNFDVQMFTNSDLVTPDPSNPNAPMERLLNRFCNCNKIFAVVPYVSRTIVKRFVQSGESPPRKRLKILNWRHIIQLMVF